MPGRFLRVSRDCSLRTVLIGNAAAALQGAPVTTVDFDFMFRKTPANLRKLKALAVGLDVVILRTYNPASGLFRIMRDDDGLQLDFMATVDGIRSLASLQSRAKHVTLGDARLLVASLRDIIKSKRAAGRRRDLAVMDVLEKALHEEASDQKSKA